MLVLVLPDTSIVSVTRKGKTLKMISYDVRVRIRIQYGVSGSNPFNLQLKAFNKHCEKDYEGLLLEATSINERK